MPRTRPCHPLYPGPASFQPEVEQGAGESFTLVLNFIQGDFRENMVDT